MTFLGYEITKVSDSNKTRRSVSNSPVVDFTNKIVADSVTTKGLYRNTLNGYKLAGVFAKNIIDTPIAFCGFPIPQTDDEEIINYFLPYNYNFVKILRQSHREGTVWVWPWYDSKSASVKLKFIEDNQVTTVFQDPITDEITSVIITRSIQALDKNGMTVSIDEKTTYDKQKITTNYSGIYKNSVKRNVLGILPINFPNMADAGEIRGYSDYTNILPDLMDYHRTALSMSIQLNDFKTKLVQTIDGDPDTWAENQGFSDLDDFILNATPQKVSMIFNSKDDKTEFITAKGMIDSNIEALKISYKKIVQGCRVPELFWGLKQEGNTNTAEEAMTSLINLVNEKRTQSEPKFTLLMNSMLRLNAIAQGSFTSETIGITWDQLDAVSDVSRSEIFKNFCEGISKVFTSGVITIDQAFDMWEENYPSFTNMTKDEFQEGLIKTVSLLQRKNSSYAETMGMNDLDSI